jgi:hypothetical protein
MITSSASALSPKLTDWSNVSCSCSGDSARSFSLILGVTGDRFLLYMCVFMCVCTYTYINGYVRIFVYICTYTYIHKCAYKHWILLRGQRKRLFIDFRCCHRSAARPLYVYMYVCMYVCGWRPAFAVHVRTYICTCICTCICMANSM